MKTFLIFGLLTLNVFAWATSANEVKNKASETVDAAADYSKEQKEAFVSDMESNLAALKSEIKTMKEKAGKSKDETVQKLENEQKRLEADLAQMKKSSGKAWTKLKSGLIKAWSEIKTSLGEAKDELKK